MHRYQRYADIAEKEEAASEGGLLVGISNLIGSMSSPSSPSPSSSPSLGSRKIHVSMEPMSPDGKSTAVARDRVGSFRERTGSRRMSFDNYLASEQEAAPIADAGGAAMRSRVGSFRDGASSSGGAAAGGSMRERVGSRRASFMDYAESGNIFTGDAAPTVQPSMSDMIPEDAESKAPAAAPQPGAEAGAVVPVVAVEDQSRNRMAGRHGLVKWVFAGDVRLWLVGASFYPLAQITRIMSDYFIRSRTRTLNPEP